MDTIISPTSDTAYFKSHKKLYKAPIINNRETIDFERAERVDYFFLTSNEFEEVMMVLDIFDEREQDEIQ
jgi:hypothetical protein